MIRQFLFTFISAAILPACFAAEVETVGQGSFLRGLPEGVKGPGGAPRLSAAVKQHRVPTNKWWSALAWSDQAFTQFPHPLAVKPHAKGLKIAYPGATITGNNAGIFGSMPGPQDDLVLSISGADKFATPVVDGWSDWFVTALFQEADRKLRVSYGHGSPYVFATCEGGAPSVIFSKPPTVWKQAGAVLGVTVGNRHYGLFAPTGSNWTGAGTATLTAEKGAYYSIAVLPDNTPETLSLFAKHAHAHVTDTKLEWAYDEKSQAATTTFNFTTVAREGSELGTLSALYPHQWRYATTPLLSLQYGSVRGALKIAEGRSFTTKVNFPGVLPWLPTTSAVSKSQVSTWLAPDLAKAPDTTVRDTYWQGKQLGRLATLSAIADSAGLAEDAGKFQQQIKTQLEAWFTATADKKKGVFAYDSTWGTLIGYPASYGSDDQLNDHHFHYGYYIKAAAELARRDPAWASNAQWGGMVKMLVRDIANPNRNDADFPFLRCFDAYAGHSWASGHSRFEDGNNNESSSEAMNAWAGMVLLGEATADKPLRDLGAWLFTTEMTAIEDYWFGVHGDTFPQNYPASVVTMVWGGKGANATWFSADPQTVHGINWLPITGASLYLGRFPEYCAKNYAALKTEHHDFVLKEAAKKNLPITSGETPWNGWTDLTWMYRSLSDPADAKAQYSAGIANGQKQNFETGHSEAALGHWIQTLASVGTVDRSVTADTALYAVFANQAQRTHAAYNSGSKTRSVKFSDGIELSIPAGSWGVKTSAK